MSAFRNAKETPAARTSMLVATAKTKSALIEKSALLSSSSSLPTASLIMLPPIIAKRANQIAAEVKQELSAKLEEFSNFADTLEETFENREQIEISRHYEKLPKPTLVAIKEFQAGEIYSRKIEA